MAVLKNLRWLTPEERDANYISEMLGTLRESGFEFVYPPGWGLWPQEYLQAVITHARSKIALMGKWAWEAANGPQTGDPFVGIGTEERVEKKQQADDFLKGMWE